jgi:hypothetical protein
MIAYHKAVDQLGGYFAGYSIEWIEQKKNEEADAISRIGSMSSTRRQSLSQRRLRL